MGEQDRRKQRGARQEIKKATQGRGTRKFITKSEKKQKAQDLKNKPETTKESKESMESGLSRAINEHKHIHESGHTDNNDNGLLDMEFRKKIIRENTK